MKENREQSEKTSILWNRLDEVYNKTAFDTDAAKLTILSKINIRKQRSKKARILWTYSVAATILLFIGISFIISDNILQKSRDQQVYSSGKSVEETILIDGSHVWLNSNSSITLPWNFSQKHRKVYLNGEAYFEVERDEANPFKVYTGKTVTEVLGTSFNIELDTLSGNVNVIVNSGKVAFYNSENKRNKEILSPDNLAVFYMQDQSIKVLSNSNLNFLSWKTGILKFYNTPIDQVCKDLSKHFNKKVLSNITATDLKLTGSFNNDSLEEILTTIELTLDVHVSILNKEYSIEN